MKKAGVVLPLFLVRQGYAENNYPFTRKIETVNNYFDTTVADPYRCSKTTTAKRPRPAHSFKFVATLQEANAGTAPTLIRIESNAGHGGGRPVSKSIDIYTDI